MLANLADGTTADGSSSSVGTLASLLHSLVDGVLAQELQSWVVHALQPKEPVPLASACGRGDLTLRLRGLWGDMAEIPPSCREEVSS